VEGEERHAHVKILSVDGQRRNRAGRDEQTESRLKLMRDARNWHDAVEGHNDDDKRATMNMSTLKMV